jgi:hypothetical protein
MTREEFADLLTQDIQHAERAVREHGQKEYAHEEDNCFANFERIGKALGLSREEVLMIYLLKHMDGIVAHIRGHRSQREDIRGRIKDARMYLALLWGMVEEDESRIDESDEPWGKWADKHHLDDLAIKLWTDGLL